MSDGTMTAVSRQTIIQFPLKWQR